MSDLRTERVHPSLPRDLGRLRILFLGPQSPGSTSGHRIGALRRLGHLVTVINPDARILPGRIGASFTSRTGHRLTRGAVARAVTRCIGTAAFDIAWVNGGSAVGPALLRELRQRARFVLNYNTDDPFGGRDGRHWDTYLDALPEYDLVVVVRKCNVAEAFAAGARDVLRVWMTYDELVHKPQTLSPDELARWRTDVAFIGTWMPERGPFLARLLRREVPLTVFGNDWMRAAERDLLARVVRPPAIGEDYVRAISAAGVCLGLLSKGNRDLHTTRSVEIPATGGLLCAERTSEHASLYRDGVEAVLWSDAEECAVRCHELLGNPELARSIATAGQQRVRQLGLGNEDMANAVLHHVGLVGAHHPPV